LKTPKLKINQPNAEYRMPFAISNVYTGHGVDTANEKNEIKT
jgi:hypothetical protein